jgi:hypothetical protein
VSDDLVEIPFDDDASEVAVLLLAAAEDLDLDPGVVRTVTGAFLVPQQVADKAGMGSAEQTEPEPEPEPGPPDL